MREKGRDVRLPCAREGERACARSPVFRLCALGVARCCDRSNALRWSPRFFEIGLERGKERGKEKGKESGKRARARESERASERAMFHCRIG